MLADGLAEFSKLKVGPIIVETNMVFFTPKAANLTAAQLVEKLKAHGVLTITEGPPNHIRAVTHCGISRKDILRVLGVFHKILKA